MRRIVFLGFLYCVLAYSKIDEVYDEFRVQKLSPVRSEFTGPSDVEPGHDAFKGLRDDKIAISSFKNGEHTPRLDDNFLGIPISVEEKDRDISFFVDDPIVSLFLPEVANTFQDRYEVNGYQLVPPPATVKSVESEFAADSEKEDGGSYGGHRFDSLIPQNFPSMTTKDLDSAEVNGYHLVPPPATVKPVESEFAADSEKEDGEFYEGHRFVSPPLRNLPSMTTKDLDIAEVNGYQLVPPPPSATVKPVESKFAADSEKEDGGSYGGHRFVSPPLRNLPSMTAKDLDIAEVNGYQLVPPPPATVKPVKSEFAADSEKEDVESYGGHRFVSSPLRNLPSMTTKDLDIAEVKGYQSVPPPPATVKPVESEFAADSEKEDGGSYGGHRFVSPIPQNLPSMTTKDLDIAEVNGYQSMPPPPSATVKPVESKFAADSEKKDGEFCDVRVDGFYRYPKNCSRIIQCFGGSAFEYPPCPNNLGFDERNGVCNYRNRVEGCSNVNFTMGKGLPAKSSRLQLAIVDQSVRSDSGFVAVGGGGVSDESAAGVVGGGAAESEGRCEAGHSHGDHISAGGDCTTFYRCVWDQKVLMNCPSGTLFNPDLDVCDFTRNVDCTNAKKKFGVAKRSFSWKL